MTEDHMQIVEEIAQDLGVEFDDVIMPEYKVKQLYKNMDEKEFRQHMYETLDMIA